MRIDGIGGGFGWKSRRMALKILGNSWVRGMIIVKECDKFAVLIKGIHPARLSLHS